MTQQDLTIKITVDGSPQKAFSCIQDVRSWWTENLEGRSQKPNDEFTVRFGDVHVSTQRLIEVVADKKIVWLVTDSRLSFVDDKDEWTGTRIIFDIKAEDGETKISFTHEGLSSRIECFDACSNAWAEYIQISLRNLINTGKGQPALKEKEGMSSE